MRPPPLALALEASWRHIGVRAVETLADQVGAGCVSRGGEDERVGDVLRAEAAPAPHAGVRPPAMGSGVRPPDQSGTLPGVAPPMLPEKPPLPPSPRPRDPEKRV